MVVLIVSAGIMGILVYFVVLLGVLAAFLPGDNEAGVIVLAAVKQRIIFSFFGRHDALISLNVDSKATGIFLLPFEGVSFSSFR